MRTIWQALAWKEWHEHKWKLAALTSVLVGVTALVTVFVFRDARQDLFEATYAMAIACIVPLSLFIGANSAASERSHGTAPFLQAMPLAPTIIAIFKLLAGLATLVVAIAFTFASIFVSYECARRLGYMIKPPLLHSGFGPPQSVDYGNWFFNRAVLASLVAGSFYLWTAAAAVNRQDEISGAARGVLAMVVSWVSLIVIGQWFDEKWLFADENQWFVAMIVSALPGGIGVVELPRTYVVSRAVLGVPLPIGIGLVFHFVPAYWYVSRFGRKGAIAGSQQEKSRSNATLDWLGPPRRSQLTAIAWKQCRESGPLVLIGLAAILAIVTIVGVLNWRNFSAEMAMQAYTSVTVAMGLLVTLVVGIGVMLFDLSPKLSTFWRSRPINPDLWYWTKVGTGLAVILVSIYVPLALIAFSGGNTVVRKTSPIEYLVFPAITIAVYISAVTMTCLVRHAIYGAILSIAALYVGPMLLLSAREAGNWLFGAEFIKTLWPMQHEVLVLVTTMSTISIATLIIGWLAVRNDWGRKSRY
jgi:hypothetical protein